MVSAKKIKDYILSRADMDFIGICPAEALAAEPQGHRPQDLLPGAKSVIVFGRRMIMGAVSSKFRNLEDKHPTALTSYSAHGNMLSVNLLMMNATYNMAQYLEKTYGCVAMPVTNNVLQNVIPEGNPVPQFADPYQAGYPLNLAKCGVLAGLGEIGWNNRLIMPVHGPRIHVIAIVTDLEMDEYDRPYSGKKLCDPQKCNVCVKMCPVNALSEYAAGKEKADLKVNSCAVASCGMTGEFNPRVKKPLVPSTDPSDGELKAAYEHMYVHPVSSSLDHISYYYCDKCLVYCPAGEWKEQYQDTGLTDR